MKTFSLRTLWFVSRAAALALGILWLCPSGWSTPYATSLTNDAGTISFRLNESADNIKVISNGGAVTNDLGALAAGLHTFPLGVSTPYQIVVFKVSPPGFVTPVAPNRGAVLQISTDTNLVRFNNPRGVTVNTDPASPYFGRVYISNTSATNAPRALGDGIYVLNADLSDAVGQGDTALTGGLDFSASATASPYRVAIGQDNNLYITDFSDAVGSVYVTDPNVGAGTGQNVLGGPAGGPFPVTNRIHGSITGAWIEGSLGAANLTVYALDEDYQTDPNSATANQRNSLWRHDIGGALPGPFVAPTQIALHPDPTSFLRTVGNQTMDLTRGTNGYFYVSNYRSSGAEANVWVLDANGSLLWDSRTATQTLTNSSVDLLRATGGLDLSRAGDYLAVINIETNGMLILPVNNGIPDITNRLLLTGFSTTAAQGRDVAFDLAGNLYAISSGAGLLRVFSPGGTTTATTGSDGTFHIIVPPGVSAVAPDLVANEAGPDTATFTLTRTGDTAELLVVNYTLTGTAVNGTDYETNELSATIPAGSATVDVVITPINDNEAEVTETVTLTLVGSASYNIKAPIADTITIVDNEKPVLSIVAVDTNSYERLPLDTVSFTVTRLGDTNVDIFGVEFITGGTAMANSDYGAPPSSVPMPPGMTSITLVLTNIDDGELEGDETIQISLGSGSGEYDVGTAGSATAWLQDNECPPAGTLFSDNLDSDTSANWIVRFGANNNVFDAITNWAFDYSAAGIPAAPNSAGGTTRGLFVSVNKDGTGSSAGINLYPAGQSFSGDYALRFDLYMSVGVSNTTEHALAGINHSGMVTNRIRQSSGVPGATNTHAPGSDGIWINIEPANSNLRDYAAYTSTNPATVPYVITNRSASTLAALIANPPYISAGAIGNRSNSLTKTWADVELRQVGDVVRLSVNKNPVLEFTTTYGFTNGNIMIGHNDQFDSIGAQQSFAIFDNVRVVSLGIHLRGIEISGGNVQIDFTSPLGGQAGDFTLQSTDNLSSGSWNNENTAVITVNGNDGFRAVIAQAAGNRFYRIRR